MKRRIILIGIIIGLALSATAQVQTVSAHLKMKNGMSTDTIGTYSGDSLIIDGGSRLRFRDTDAGLKTLSELTAGGSSISFGSQYEIPITNATSDDFDYTSYLTWTGGANLNIGSASSYIYLSRLYGMYMYINNSAYIRGYGHSNSAGISGLAISGNKYGGTVASPLVAPSDAVMLNIEGRIYDGTNNISGGYISMLVDGAISTGDFDTKILWNLRDATSVVQKMNLEIDGLHIVDTTFTDHIKASSRLNIYNPTDIYHDDDRPFKIIDLGSGGSGGTPDASLNVLGFYDAHGDNQALIGVAPSGDVVISSYISPFNIQFGGNAKINGELYPTSNKTKRNGLPSYYWQSVRADSSYIGDENTHLSVDVSNNLTLTDAVTGTKTLAELAAAGSADSSWIKASVDTLASHTSDEGSYIIFDNAESGHVRLAYETAAAIYEISTGGTNPPKMQATSITNDTHSRVTAGTSAVVLERDSTGTSNDREIIVNYYGLSGLADYSSYATDLSYVQKAYVDAATDSSWRSITFDTAYVSSSGSYITRGDAEKVVIGISGASSVEISNNNFNVGEDRAIIAERVMLVKESQIIYSNTSQTAIVALPADAVVWDVSFEVRTAFNGTGNNYLSIGTSGDIAAYIENSNIGSTGWTSASSPSVPDRMTSSTNIQFQYTDQNSDASAGEAYVYVHYSLH